MKPEDISYFEKNYRFVFQPKDPSKFGGRNRFYISSGRLEEYIGKHNAETVIEKAEAMMTNFHLATIISIV